MVGSDRGLGFLLDFSRDAMGAEDGDGAGRHVLQRLDEARAFRLQRFDHVAIVDDLMAHIDRRAMLGERPLDNVDRPDDAGAKPARLGKNDLHSLAFSSEPRRAKRNARRPQPVHAPPTNFEREAIRRNLFRDKRWGADWNLPETWAPSGRARSRPC